MRLIPAIDIIDGKCVRLTKGDYSTTKIYNENPLEVAKQFEAHGIKHLHMVDLDGAKAKSIVNYKVLELVASKTSLKIDFGGGIKSDEDIKVAFNSGAQQITAGSIAVKNKAQVLKWLSTYGSDKIILGADCRDKKIATQGWTETSSLDVIDFIKDYELAGIKSVICTDISKDGMLEGASEILYKEIMEQTTINLIASGGVANMDDLYSLKALGCEGAIIGKAIYEGRITMKQLEELC
ncbi:imidazole-4-carboxamide isomerase [unidentified eubacterium SCB49]|nr:imidazole-4-carboxamide isomerase [unidentified eubacterium SCB49]